MTYEPCFRFLQFIQKKCLLSNERYGILDLGGYLVGAFHKAIAEDKFCIGAVEDTKSGLWADQKILELKIPIISVASSRLKDEVEGLQVGSSVARSIENILLNKLHTSLFSKRVMVIGFRGIGRNVALSIRKYGALVSVFDKNPVAMVIARIFKDFKLLRKRRVLVKAMLLFVALVASP